jgi:hypothetical protein
MCAPQLNRQTKARAMRLGLLQVSSLGTRPAPLGAKSRAIRRVLFQANSRAKLLVTAADSASPRLRRANWRPPLLGPPAKVKVLVQQPAKPPLLEPQDWLLPQAPEILQAQVRARQCLRCLGPFAFFREILDAQKCNRAARCGDCPIFVQCHRRCNRRGLVDYGNKHSRWLHKRARLARTFLIAGADKCPSPLRRIQD